MKILEQLKAKNPEKNIAVSSAPEFRKYGSKLVLPPGGGLLEKTLELFGSPEPGNTYYTASDPELEQTPDFRWISDFVYGEMVLQAGCCYGYNTRMNGMEYHKSSEIFGAASDCVLVLGSVCDIEKSGQGTAWDSSRAEFFFLGKGEWVELYATTLHLAPCRVTSDPFCSVIILPKGTNTPLNGKPVGSLWMNNKWLLAHADSPAASKGAYQGISGKNYEVYPAG